MNFQLWKADNIVLIFACLDLLLGKATLNLVRKTNGKGMPTLDTLAFASRSL